MWIMNSGLGMVVIAAALLFTSEGKVKVKKNSYRGLVIAINPEIEEDPAIIDGLKSAWTDASRDLFRATKSRVYYKSVTILVPKTWSNGNYNPSNGETYKKAEVVVADQNPVYGDNPYTVQYGKCGERGSYIHLTPRYLTDDQAVNNYGPRGKTLVHEWGHFRWGVFDERVTSGYDSFYLSRTGEIEANRCPLTVTGDNYYVDWSAGTYRDCNIEPQTMLPEDGCVFFADESRSSQASTSMMSYQFLDSVYTFCHDDTTDATNLHNKEAPNEHNRLCNLRSTWDVIINSPDFEGNETVPNNEIEDTIPTFDVVRPVSYQRFVLVLDTSGSMDGDRLLMMRQAASTFILQAAPSESDIGIVEFASTATTLSDLTRINSYSDRHALVEKLPISANGGTSIGSGILEGLEVLSKDCSQTPTSKCTSGGILIVLSDGEENADPTLSMVYQDIIDAGVIVDSMVFTADADPMLQVIAQDTGGTWYFADENAKNATSALTDAFVTVAQVDDGDSYRENFQIHSSSFTIDKYATHTGQVIIDRTVGNNTVFSFAWSQYSIIPGVVLEAPDGCTFSTATPPGIPCEPGSSPIVDADFKTITFPISGTAQTGTWKYYVSTSSAYSQNMVSTVTSMASNRNVEPILVESGMGNVNSADGEAVVVYAQVSMGYAPVLNAEVMATVERPTGGPVTIVLKDKGAAPDVRKNDGIYSRYFTKYNGPGRYSVQVTVTGIDGQTTSAYDAAGSKAASKLGSIDANGNLKLNLNNAPVVPSQTSTGIFSRSTSAGGFSFTGTSYSDTFPPSQILDLATNQQDTTTYNSGIRITFTAPGDDYDAGTASFYDIRYTYGDILDLTTNFTRNKKIAPSDVLAGCITSPQVAGSEESFLVSLPDLPDGISEQTVGFAVRAVDDVGNEGMVSNVVTVNYFIEPLVTSGSTTDVELILMIVFACTTAILLVAVAVLLWMKQKLRHFKVNAGDNPRRVA